jgi:hypothetical protein
VCGGVGGGANLHTTEGGKTRKRKKKKKKRRKAKPYKGRRGEERRGKGGRRGIISKARLRDCLTKTRGSDHIFTYQNTPYVVCKIHTCRMKPKRP